MENLIEKKLAEYLKEDNALSYTPEMVGHKSGYTDEIRKINAYLCGMSNIASIFMNNPSNAEEFFNNVKFNGVESTPVIVRAIQIALQNSVV